MQKRATAPVHLALAENSLFYYFVGALNQFKIGNIELYEQQADWSPYDLCIIFFTNKAPVVNLILLCELAMGYKLLAKCTIFPILLKV